MNGIAAYSGLQSFENQSVSRYHTRSERNIQPQASTPDTSLRSAGGGGKLHDCNCTYKGGDISQIDARSAKRLFAAKLLDISGAERNDATRSGYSGRSAVAARFLGNVAEQLSKATTREEATAVLDTARQQIGEARGAVDGLQLELTDRAERKLDKLVNTLQKGLDNLEEKFLPKPIVVNTSQASVEYTAEAKAILDIKTQDGDKVSLRFQSSSSLKADATYTNDGRTEVKEANVFISSDAKLQIEIDGDLDDDEVAAIKDVLSQIDNIAQRFFGGDIEQAIAGLENFSFDDSELSSVGLDLALKQEINVSQVETTSTILPPSPLNSLPVDVADVEDDAEAAPVLADIPVLDDVKETSQDEANTTPNVTDEEPVKLPPIVTEQESDQPAETTTQSGQFASELNASYDSAADIREKAISEISASISEHFSIQGSYSGGNVQQFVERQTVTQILSNIIDVRDRADKEQGDVAKTEATQEVVNA